LHTTRSSQPTENWFQALPTRYKRITSTGDYEPRIDGLRFVAIMSVIFCHVRTYVQSADIPQHHIYIENILYNLLHGVQLFFALSGYILAQAFFKQTAAGKPIALKKYYLRRLTRLEPPYFVALGMSFFALVFVLHKYGFAELLPHLGLSVLYSNWLFYPGAHPLSLPLAWSLEVEIVFYVLFPLLFWLYTRSLPLGRLLSITLIAAMPLGLSACTWVVHTNLIFQLPYFMAGFLVADMRQHFPPFRLPKPLAISLFLACAWGCIAYTWVGDAFPNGIRPDIQPIFLFYIIYSVLVLDIFPTFFTQKHLVFIGGMCYSLYLTHFMVISLVGRWSIKYRFTNDFLINYALQALIWLPCILVVGFLFYIFIERPAMKIALPKTPKSQNTQLMQKIIILLLCLSANMAFAQSDNELKVSATDTTYVIANEGLDLYEKPQKSAKILLKIPCGAAIQPLEVDGEERYMQEKLSKIRFLMDDVEGFWLKVKYNNTKGYCFNAFLHTQKPDTIASDIVLLKPNADYHELSYSNLKAFNWYGIYKKDNLRLLTQKIENITFYKKMETSDEGARTHLSIKNKVNVTDSLVFIIGLRKKNNSTIAGGMLPESLYMGGLFQEKNCVLNSYIDAPDLIPIGYTDWRLKLEKTFIRVAPKSEGGKPTAELTDWKLLLVRKDFRQKQTLMANDSTFSPPFALDAYGDFDEDGKLDFIISNENNGQLNHQYQLFLSSIFTKSGFIKCSANPIIPFTSARGIMR
jgi:peptidoglycan/LPS O-acetylase OafA/YrhL